MPAVECSHSSIQAAQKSHWMAIQQLAALACRVKPPGVAYELALDSAISAVSWLSGGSLEEVYKAKNWHDKISALNPSSWHPVNWPCGIEAGKTICPRRISISDLNRSRSMCTVMTRMFGERQQRLLPICGLQWSNDVKLYNPTESLGYTEAVISRHYCQWSAVAVFFGPVLPKGTCATHKTLKKTASNQKTYSNACAGGWLFASTQSCRSIAATWNGMPPYAWRELFISGPRSLEYEGLSL